MWPHLLAAVLGIWLMASPAVLDYGGAAADVHHVVGPLVATFGLIAAWDVTRAARFANLPLAFALIVAPAFVDHEWRALLNGFAVAIVVAASALFRGRARRAFGGGWRRVPSGGAG